MDLLKLKELKDLLDNEVITKEEFELMKKSLMSDFMRPNDHLNNESEKIIDSAKGQIESVKIGEQEWTVKNLNLTHFNNGDIIPEADTIEKWQKADIDGTPAWCYYDNDPENGEEHGALYNFHVITDKRGIAPSDYRIPTKKDFEKLKLFVGDDEELSKKLKSRNGWAHNGTNRSGFNGKPSGGRSHGPVSSFYGKDDSVQFWIENRSVVAKESFYICDMDELFYVGFCGVMEGDGISIRLIKK